MSLPQCLCASVLNKLNYTSAMISEIFGTFLRSLYLLVFIAIPEYFFYFSVRLKINTFNQ